ncbi:sporulation-specific N-acetylmuramoyl-L-alanine amidase [Virgibacillus pantothenticus]|uniref:N-acetylmuramoyl-L-alanine amidase n=1 Tax=Virgibacillus TaxID=84406 RepID=UPI00090AAF40|nr:MULTISPECIES: N-acetylmuramoyl-L-alanine amidase [Virgibacillus]API91980.1 N-acetylmuramoyl-L-alanine amidase [Virgibacillus sp. 6R]MBS7430437.1 N-acetylmuramoyl-L-alanine amidase [Virgibacillus sp. 19R1-5]MBU8566375.1 N-acetylmuramoyl-L-alanine amidase [Virgibacillus pantothenticus]MBU8600209.1 N-acetylmuramoyl-L-alanine amidase [Virgibacillus pantothenticus]MBU8633859.1 N-acetylmuramoyl-L-alanine amidase [Virgibacillus pantothenticus]
MKIFVDPGHGGSDNGASGNGLFEKNVTLDIATRIRNILINEYENVQVRMSRTTDATVSLTQRTNNANNWGADYFLSIHCNAFNGTARGYEDYIHSSLSSGSQTGQYQDQLHEEITKVNQLSNRGQKKADFHVLRESSMPALLTENGFIDNANDASLMGSTSWRQAVARGHVNGLEQAFNLQKKENSNVIFRIIAGSFQSKDNADQLVNMLAAKGIQAFVALVRISGRNWYRVQAGAFSNRTNAENHLERVKKAGVTDAYIIRETR